MSMLLMILGCTQRPAVSFTPALQLSSRAHARQRTVEADGVTGRIADDQFHARFTADGSVDLGEGLQVRTIGFGRATASLPFEHAGPGIGDCGAESCIQFLGPQLTERWSAAPAGGFEQGWTVHTRPSGAGALVVALRMPPAQISADGTLASVSGERSTWTVSGLRAWDADGVVLPSRFESTLGGLRVVVDDGGAAYPVTIDPLYSHPDYELGSELMHLEGGGDVNGDGYSDIVAADDGIDGYGYVFLGTATGIETRASSRVAGLYTSFHRVDIGFAGDVNADGYDDVIAVADMADAVYIYAGGADGLATDPTWTLPEFAGMDGQSAALPRAAGAGDVDADGFDDVIVGSPNWGDPGSAWVYFGSASGLDQGSGTELHSGSSPVDGDVFGESLGAAGDVNGDGYDDVVVGAASPYTSVFYGSSAGVSQSSMTALATHDGFAEAAVGVGDVNGDGYSDVIVGVPSWTASGTGEARLFLGGAGGIAAEAAWVKAGSTTRSYYGLSASRAGDVNADGYGDVIIQGRIQGHDIFLGSETGLGADPAATLRAEYDDEYVSTAGDVNRDGAADVAISHGHVYLSSTFLDTANSDTDTGSETDSDSDADTDADTDSGSGTDTSADEDSGAGSERKSGCSGTGKTGCASTPNDGGPTLLIAVGVGVTLVRRRKRTLKLSGTK